MPDSVPPDSGPADTASQRAALIEAALAHALFDGMNMTALLAGARDLGIPPDLARVLVPGGGAGLAAGYHRAADRQLAGWLADQPVQGRIRDRIADAVLYRLSLVDRELVRSGAAVLARPGNLGLATRLMGETADIIWSGLGDPSRDVNWWSKRAILASVLAATVLYWLDDHSPGGAETRAFLDRRIGEVMQFEKTKARLAKVPGMAALAQAATGWIQAPGPRDLPGGRA